MPCHCVDQLPDVRKHPATGAPWPAGPIAPKPLKANQYCSGRMYLPLSRLQPATPTGRLSGMRTERTIGAGNHPQERWGRVANPPAASRRPLAR